MSDQLNIYGLEREVDRIGNMVSSIGSQVDQVDTKLDATLSELAALKHDFTVLMQQQHARLIMNNATTEFIKIRQELEKSFGTYNQVRLDMLGILQATDSYLVRKDTISRITEEVMIEVPEYWLAPCLVALSAWINNDRNLAQRAIAEAVKRDEEKTALVMALICRRNNRIAAAHQWLAVYFSHQKVADFTEDTFVFLDAYVNGIFGDDEYHVCEDYVRRWRQDIEQSLGKDPAEQDRYWREYFKSYEKSDIERYPNLVDNTLEFAEIDEYLSGISSSQALHARFDKLNKAQVDKEQLRCSIDQKLIDLVNSYEAAEEKLLQSERLQEYILAYHGDDKAARQRVRMEQKARQHKAVGALDRMRGIVISDTYKDLSTKKTALKFLKEDINKSYKGYIQDKKQVLPSQVTIQVNDWSHPLDSTSDSIKQDYKKYADGLCSKEKDKVKQEASSKLTWTVLFSVLTAIGFYSYPILGIVFLIFAIKYFKKYRSYNKTYEELDKEYEQRYEEGCKVIDSTISQWHQVCRRADAFNEEPVLRLVS